jgi:glycosyltransferase involved in cell wall biosynthesis
MVVLLLEQLIRHGRYHITFMVSHLNQELTNEVLRMAPAVESLSTSYSSGRGQWLRTYLSLRALFQLCRQIRSLRPELVVVVQGGIALSSLGLLAARLAGVRTISYIPMTHSESLFASSAFRAGLRQWLVQPFYRLPHCLITISQRMANYAALRRAGRIRVIENGIELPDLEQERRHELRSELGLQESDRLLLMIGRIELWQKRHDLTLQAIAIARSRGVKLHLLVVGGGEDERSLRQQVKQHALGDVVHWRAWQPDVMAFYAASDVLVLPSRYEGVPLVMLEAMYAGRKVIASDVDGMADILPSSWMFPSGDAEAFADLLCLPENASDADTIQRHRELIASEYTTEAFGRRFLQVIDEELVLAHA